MKSEFSTFVMKIQVPLQKTPTLFEEANYLYSNPHRVKDYLFNFYERILFIAHNIQDQMQLKKEVVQIQILMTDLVNKYYRNGSFCSRILRKLTLFLEDFRDQFPKEFNKNVAYPDFAYSQIQAELNTKQYEIIKLLTENKIDNKLIDSLNRYFLKLNNNGMRAPSWKDVEYRIQVLNEIMAAIQNEGFDQKMLENRLLRAFIRNNFNKKPIMEYCTDLIRRYLHEQEENEEELVDRFLYECSSIVYSGLSYDEYSISLQEQVETLLVARKRFLQSELSRRLEQTSAGGSCTITPLWFTEPSEITVLFNRLLYEIDFMKEPKPKGKFYIDLAEIIRGPGGYKYEASTLQKGVTVESLDHIDRVGEILTKMQKKNDDIRFVFLNKKVK